jgi:hypothetical protein
MLTAFLSEQLETLGNSWQNGKTVGSKAQLPKASIQLVPLSPGGMGRSNN